MRVSYVSTLIHDHLDPVVGLPTAFETLLSSPTSVLGVDVTLPYAADTPIDRAFWSMAMDGRDLAGPVDAKLANKLRKAGVPLRHRAGLDIAGVGGPTYLEVHVHPFGVVAIATTDLISAAPQPVTNAGQAVDTMQTGPATATVAGTTIATTPERAAADAAAHIVGLLAKPGGTQWADPPDYRIVSIIDGTPQPQSMPPVSGAIHTALHDLCRGTPPPGPPLDLFVPRWRGGKFAWSPTELGYMLDRGMAAWSAPARRPGVTAGERHRQLVLLVAHVTAAVGLAHASATSVAPTFRQWAIGAAQRVGRLYGPTDPMQQGLEARLYVVNTGAQQVIDNVLQQLTPPRTLNIKWPVPTTYP